LLGALITGVAGYQIKRLIDAVDDLTEKNIVLNTEKSKFDLKNVDANKLIVSPGQSKTTSKAK
jgi:hypothetical protein